MEWALSSPHGKRYSQESGNLISDETHSGRSAEKPDWFFQFRDGETDAHPAHPSAAVDALEFAKATLQQQLSQLDRTTGHLQSLIRRSHAAGVGVADLAVHSGLSVTHVERVLSGTPLLDVLFEK